MYDRKIRENFIYELPRNFARIIHITWREAFCNSEADIWRLLNNNQILLNELFAYDQARFEEAYLNDGSLFEYVRALEEELIENYVKERLWETREPLLPGNCEASLTVSWPSLLGYPPLEWNSACW